MKPSPRQFSPRQWGVTLVELVVVISIMALMLGVAVPGIRALMRAFRSEDAVMSMVNTALATARSLALERGHYVGVRFQKRDSFASLDGSADDLKRVIEATQSMIFIESSEPEGSDLVHQFDSIDGFSPVDLPAGNTLLAAQFNQSLPTDANQVRDASTFSVVFSPAGRMVTKPVRLVGQPPWIVPRSRLAGAPHGLAFIADPNDTTTTDKLTELDQEPSQDNFWICDDLKLKQAFQDGLNLKTFLSRGPQQHVYVKPYGGTLVRSESDPNSTN